MKKRFTQDFYCFFQKKTNKPREWCDNSLNRLFDYAPNKYLLII